MIAIPASNDFSDYIIREFKKTYEYYEIEITEVFTKDNFNNFRQKDNILEQIRASAPDLILAMGDQVLLLLKDHFDDIPIVYVCGSDISERIAQEKNNITGLREALDPEKLMDLISQTMILGKRVLGVIYDAHNEEEYVEKAEKAAKKNGITLIRVRITRPYCSKKNEDNILKMLKNADAVWMLPYSGTGETRAFVSYHCMKNGIYIYSFSENMTDGELMSVSTDPRDIGNQAGTIAMMILLSQKTPGAIPIAYPRKGNITVNLDMAELLNLKTDKMTIPKGWLLEHKRYKKSFRNVRSLWP